MKKTVLTFGLIAGLVVAAIMAISMCFAYGNPNYEGGMVLGYASMLIAFSFIFVGIKQLRDKYSGGVISFGRAFRVGLYITLIASSFYVAAWLVEYYCFMPDFMERYGEHMMKEVRKTGTAAQIQEKMAEVQRYKEYYKNPLFVIFFTYCEILPVGLIVSLIAALILKKKPRPQMVM